jgi:hypothetical protein
MTTLEVGALVAGILALFALAAWTVLLESEESDDD